MSFLALNVWSEEHYKDYGGWLSLSQRFRFLDLDLDLGKTDAATLGLKTSGMGIFGMGITQTT